MSSPTPDAAGKSTVEEIRGRFDADVERFSNIETGQSATVDAPLALELIAEAAAATTPRATAALDVGCGAGNYSLMLLRQLPGLEITLLDLSRPMLDRAAGRVASAGAARVAAIQADVRDVDLPDGSFDIILAAAVLHHLRDDSQWRAVFAKFHRLLRPGGSLWVSDLIAHENPAVQRLMWRRYGDYLTQLKGGGPDGDRYRDGVFAYIEREDTPRSLGFQLGLLAETGFRQIDVLHKNSCFAAFGAVK